MLPIYIRRRQPAAADQIDGNTMAKVLQRVEITLRSFYIFNSSFCQKEGEEEKKVLFYHPVDIELNTKIRDVGLSEAIITFTGTFTNEDDCKALHTQKTTQLFHQPEPGYWLVMVLNVPKEFRLKDGIEVADYRGVEVSDRIYHAVLRQCYHMYRFHYGLLQTKLTASPSTAASEEQRQLLAAELQQFYARYLSSSKELKQCDIMDMLHSIQYLALDKTLFLRAHNFNMLCDTFPVIKECIMLYNEQVVCGGKLNASDLYSLHSHILAMSSADNSNAEKYRQGAFVSGEEETPIKVYLDVDGNIESHYLLVYRALSLTLCLFVDGNSKLAAPQPEFYEELNNYLGPQLSCLSRDISTEISKQNVSTTLHDNNSNDSAPKYLFINEQSLKHHTNIYRNAKSIPRNVMSIIADLANPINDTNAAGNAAATEELQVKTTNDYWIVKRRCNWRQYYVILCKSKATLLDVTQEAKRIFEQELTDDVFFDK
ncbi:vacuolar fusion protein CCZ1 homolog isoform X1 [Drosophila sulfurigaster albostrigata]|uniref:vacuolar fusion protein CCZ1 homolog isoform X1 n=1 Tax=Drosophila sulfurigaster albostrigata TaxID=89887 RepID=UPI002D218DCB|nr:vacuolar fusion protein CCZ1 homolog isoform X1 [Drosophila sulfurigaster albostrigata]